MTNPNGLDPIAHATLEPAQDVQLNKNPAEPVFGMALNNFTQTLKHSLHPDHPSLTSRLRPAPISEIRLPSVINSLKIGYSHGIAASFNERDNILVTRNPRRIKVEHKLQNRLNDRLYWSIVVETSRSLIPLAVSRYKFKRKWNNAFVQALKDSGLDYHGRILPASHGKPSGPALTGTLEIKIFNAVSLEDEDQSRMLKHSINIVKGLQGRSKKH